MRSVVSAAGLHVVDTYPQRTSLRVRGSAGAIGRFLRAPLADYRDRRGVRYHAPLHAPRIPPAISGDVTTAAGLNTRPVIRKADIPNSGLKPLDAAKAYNVVPLHDRGLLGQGQTIAILSFDSFKQSDVDDFDRRVGIKDAPAVKHISVDGGTQPGAAQDENNLDIDVIRGQAPKAQILNYETSVKNGSFAPLVRQVVADGKADIVSVSWGACEPSVDESERVQTNRELQSAVAQGITVLFSSGDNGAYACQNFSPTDRHLAPSFPATSPYAIGVGGTLLSVRADGGYREETGWEDILSGSGAGGGVSSVEPRPTWQQGPGVSNRFSDGRRQVPDIGATASGHSGFYVVYGGEAHVIGGTSAATPFVAASLLLIRQEAERRKLGGLGFIGPALYRMASAPDSPFHDVTKGGNRYYPATPGWDFVSGVGTPNVARLADRMLSELAARKGT